MVLARLAVRVLGRHLSHLLKGFCRRRRSERSLTKFGWMPVFSSTVADEVEFAS
jgi:hypothetical protein